MASFGQLDISIVIALRDVPLSHNHRHWNLNKTILQGELVITTTSTMGQNNFRHKNTISYFFNL